MRQVHDALRRLQGQVNPLDGVASEIASEARVLCFDEFFVSDITDAMILSGILDGLFRARGHVGRNLECPARGALQRWFAAA